MRPWLFSSLLLSHSIHQLDTTAQPEKFELSPGVGVSLSAPHEGQTYVLEAPPAVRIAIISSRSAHQSQQDSAAAYVFVNGEILGFGEHVDAAGVAFDLDHLFVGDHSLEVELMTADGATLALRRNFTIAVATWTEWLPLRSREMASTVGLGYVAHATVDVALAVAQVPIPLRPILDPSFLDLLGSSWLRAVGWASNDCQVRRARLWRARMLLPAKARRARLVPRLLSKGVCARENGAAE